MFIGLSQLTNVRSFNCSSVFFFVGFSAIIPDRDFWSDFRSGISFGSFIGIRRFKRLEFRLEILFPFNLFKQVSFVVWLSLLRLIRFFLQTGALKLNFLVRSLFEFYLCIKWVLIVCLFVCDRVPGVRRLLLWISKFHGSSARQVTLWSYLFYYPVFIALDQPSNIAWLGSN